MISFARSGSMGVAMALAVAFAVCSERADAASLGGWSGKADNPSNEGCFAPNSVFQPNTAFNNCGSTILYDVPLLLNAAGSHTVTVAASSMSCTLLGLSQSGTIQSSQSGTVSGTLNLTVNVSGVGASALLRCNVPSGGSIQSLNYNL